MRSKYYSYTLVILSYVLLAIVAETLINLQAAIMRLGANGFLENNMFFMVVFLMALVGYAATKTIKLAE